MVALIAYSYSYSQLSEVFRVERRSQERSAEDQESEEAAGTFRHNAKPSAKDQSRRNDTGKSTETATDGIRFGNVS